MKGVEVESSSRRVAEALRESANAVKSICKSMAVNRKTHTAAANIASGAVAIANMSTIPSHSGTQPAPLIFFFFGEGWETTITMKHFFAVCHYTYYSSYTL